MPKQTDWKLKAFVTKDNLSFAPTNRDRETTT